jgi:hypothetical protein
MRGSVVLFAITTFVWPAVADKPVAMKDLPPAVQKAVTEQTKSAELKGLSKEAEHGVTTYEIETMAGGKHRDVSVDAKGNITAVEEETAIDAIPSAARAAIEKRVATGKLGMVETVTKGKTVIYEAQYVTKGGKKSEVAVKSDGTPVKD